MAKKNYSAVGRNSRPFIVRYWPKNSNRELFNHSGQRSFTSKDEAKAFLDKCESLGYDVILIDHTQR